MKKLPFIAMIWGLLLFGFSINAQEKSEFPVISFEETEYEFGEINQGDKVNHTFKFTNTGKKPLVLSNVTTTCGCTAPDWPKEPIAPGKEGEIKVVFNSAGKLGMQNKAITIYANTEEGIARVTLKGNVKKD